MPTLEETFAAPVDITSHVLNKTSPPSMSRPHQPPRKIQPPTGRAAASGENMIYNGGRSLGEENGGDGEDRVGGEAMGRLTVSGDAGPTRVQQSGVVGVRRTVSTSSNPFGQFAPSNTSTASSSGGTATTSHQPQQPRRPGHQHSSSTSSTGSVQHFIGHHNQQRPAASPIYPPGSHQRFANAAGQQNYPQHAPSRHPVTEVKFVNSTVENLEDQIRKEEAPKKKRTRTTPEQLRILQKAFLADPMPNSVTRIALAKKLGMNARAVQVWFQNRRAKAKLDAKRAEGGGGSGGLLSNAESDMEGDDDSMSVQSDGPPAPTHHRSFRATNQSLKATGMVGRMAFPADMDYLSPSFYGNDMMSCQPLSRSQSLPFLGNGNFNNFPPHNGHHGPIMMQQQHGQSDAMYFDDDFELPGDIMMMMEGMQGGDRGNNVGGAIPARSDSAPFIPYEFSAGSLYHPGGDEYAGGNGLNRCQSLPGPVAYPDTFIDQSLWPSTTVAPFDDMTGPAAIEDTRPAASYNNVNKDYAAIMHAPAPPSNHLRRSLSLPNVFQPDLLYGGGSLGRCMEEEAGEEGDDDDGDDTLPANIPELDDLMLLDTASPPILDDHCLRPSFSGHTRSRSHSISHHPDYPANLNDYLTAPSHLDADC